MMDLTPLEVRQKKGDFRRAMRGYDADLVNDFLDIVADRLETLVREKMHLAERVAILEDQVREFRERERAMTEALVTAQEMREELRRQSLRESEVARREAELEATRIRNVAAQQLEREREALTQLRARRSQMVRSYRAFLERELSEVAILEHSLAADKPGDDERPEQPGLFTAPSAAPRPSGAAPVEQPPAKPDAPRTRETPAAKSAAAPKPAVARTSPPPEAVPSAADAFADLPPLELIHPEQAAPHGQEPLEAAPRRGKPREKDAPPPQTKQKDWLSSILEEKK
jgi:cell division initiation protein